MHEVGAQSVPIVDVNPELDFCIKFDHSAVSESDRFGVSTFVSRGIPELCVSNP